MMNTEAEWPARLCTQYLAMGNGDLDGRELAVVIGSLWADGGAHTSRRTIARGHKELEARVLGTVEHWIVEERRLFRQRGEATHHHNVVRLAWEMVAPDGDVESIGTEVLVVGDDRKIENAYQFIDD